MNLANLYRLALISAFLISLVIVNAQPVSAQAETLSSRPSSVTKVVDQTNLDAQLHLIIATNTAGQEGTLPPSLGPVLRQLRATLPFQHYRLATTLLNRVRNGGRLNLKWVGGPLLNNSSSPSSTPSFNEFTVNEVNLVEDTLGREVIQMSGFNFGARIPVQTSTAGAPGTSGFPVINYEPTGIRTDISMPEGEPVIVGTLSIGPSGDAIIVVASAKRTSVK